jgi:4'-phosphopantetheinyl transferase
VNLKGYELTTARFERFLSSEEKRRVRQFRFDPMRRRYILTHGALRLILSDYLGTSPATLRFGKGRFGKPFLINSSEVVSFNLSHCIDLALITVTAGRSVGIDVERVRDLQYLDAIVKRFFSPDEQDLLYSAPAGERSHAFFTIWTRREAVVKALGLNLRTALTDIQVPPYACGGSTVVRNSGTDEPVQQGASNAWCLQDLPLGPLHRGTVCVEGKESTLVVREFK